MTDHFENDLHHQTAGTDRLTADEGGLRPPDHLRGWRRWWWWFDFLILVKLARLRFIAILIVIGVVITQWDLLVAYYERFTRPSGESAASDSTTEYFCPMHPAVVRDNSKEKCPICFMPLAKRKRGSGHEEALPAGIVNRVQLSPYRVVLAGVETIPVERLPLTRTVTAVGTVDFNERGQKVVSARVAGRIDTLLVNQTGQMVEEGQDLAMLYSPDLMVSIDSLVQAQQRKDRDFVADTRERLRLLGVSDDQLHRIVKDGKTVTHLAIRSPIAGHVIQKHVKEGQTVEEGMTLYEIADLSTVWIQAQVYEDDMSLLPLSQNHELRAEDVARIRVTARTRALPNEVFEGKLAFVYPHVDEGTRTVTVRFEVDNPQHRLRPGTTATVTLKVMPDAVMTVATTDGAGSSSPPANGVLAVPESAIIDTGSQKLVYREAEPGVYEGVLVELGPKMKSADDVTYYPILKGLVAGEKVVAAGSFLIDAETRLNPAAGSIYFGGSSGAKDSTSQVTMARPTTPDDPDAKINAALAKLSPADRQLAVSQRLCPILNSRLGSMGVPVKLTIRDEPVYLCCEACRDKALKQGDATVQKVKDLRKQVSTPTASTPTKQEKLEREIADELAKLAPADRALAAQQKFCVVFEKSRLGSMGPPVKLTVGGETVFLCCEGCEQSAQDDPETTIARLKQLKAGRKVTP